MNTRGKGAYAVLHTASIAVIISSTSCHDVLFPIFIFKSPTSSPPASFSVHTVMEYSGGEDFEPRRENFGDGFICMVTAMKDLSEKYPEVDFVYPMHLNPNVRKPIHEVFGEDLTRPNFFFIEPLQYLEFVHLMSKATIVLTDSGGIQEEAPGLGKPVLVMRDTTERPEALESGTVHLVGTDYDKIMNEVSTLLEDAEAYAKMSQAVNPYGDGLACERIVSILEK